MIPYQSIHFIGVLTPEMASLAAFSRQLNILVTASDDHTDTVFLPSLVSQGVNFFDLFAQVNVNRTTELVVLSRYHDLRHTEVEAATRLNIPVMGEVDFAKLISQGRSTVAILGDYDAKLTAGLLSHVWSQAQIPLDALTGCVPTDSSKPLALHQAAADAFIIPFRGFKRDATTYEAEFLAFEADTVVFPSIVYDYPELNNTLDDVYQAYYTFVKRVPRKGLIIGNGDYSRMQRLRTHIADRHIATYGFDRGNTWQIRDVEIKDSLTTFSLVKGQEKYGPFEMPYVGHAFLYSAVAVCVLLLNLAIEPVVIGRGLASAPQFRRFITVAHDRFGRLIIDDQADHPDHMAMTIDTVRTRYPGKKIWCLYQPKSYLRTRALLPELEKSLAECDFVYLTDIAGYPHEKSERLNIRQVVAEMKRTHPQTYYFDNPSDMAGLLADRVASSDCILALGADGIAQTIISTLLSPPA